MLALTHREFHLIADENVAKQHDRNEQEAMYAIMYAAASRGKGKKGKLPSIKDLYDRDRVGGDSGEGEEDKIQDALERQKQAEKWLERFDLNSLSNGNSGEGGK